MSNNEYWQKVREEAAKLEADGCSGVPDFHLDCCLEHDIHYRTRFTIDGQPISRRKADARFRKCIQSRSKFGKMSPMSWWRWAGVRIFGRSAWKGNKHGETT